MSDLTEQCKAKDKVISKLLDACSFLLSEYEKTQKEVPQHVYDALLFDEQETGGETIPNETQERE